MLSALLAVLTAVEPVPASLEVAKELHAQLDVSTLEARLEQEGFRLVGQGEARVRLVVARHLGGVELMARAGGQSLSRLVEAPDEVWPVERTFELAQRLAVLAHEAQALVPAPPPPVEPTVDVPPPPAPSLPLVATSHEAPRFGLLARPGALVRSNTADFSFAAVGLLRLGRLEPMLALGFDVAPGSGGTAVEFPLLGGVRVVFEPAPRWRLSPEALVGLRLHAFLDGDTAPRVDPALQLGLSARRQVGDTLWLGLAVYGFLSTGRTHLAGDVVLWERGPVGFGAGLDVEF